MFKAHDGFQTVLYMHLFMLDDTPILIKKVIFVKTFRNSIRKEVAVQLVIRV